MGVIFWLSSRTADESSAQSGAILKWLIEHFGDNFFTTFIVRKSAHFCEYAGLSLLFCNAYYRSKVKYWGVFAVISSSVYAVTDELHQLFVDGRSCQVSDWFLDTCGALCGALFCFILYIICKRVAQKKKYIDTKNI